MHSFIHFTNIYRAPSRCHKAFGTYHSTTKNTPKFLFKKIDNKQGPQQKGELHSVLKSVSAEQREAEPGKEEKGLRLRVHRTVVTGSSQGEPH